MNSGSGASETPGISRWPAYIIAMLATAIAVATTLPLQRTFERFPYLPLLVGAVIVSSWIGGLRPGLAAAGGGAVAAEYLVSGDFHSVGTHPELLAQLTVLVAVAAIVTSTRAARTRTSMAHRNRLLWELQERVKELTLLHRASGLLQEEKDLKTLLHELVELVPAGWQFPEMTEARISVRDLVISTPRFRVTQWIQRSEFAIDAGPPGILEVVYLDALAADTADPFLPEERSLIRSLANLLASHFERIHRMEERLELTRAQASRTEAETANRMKDAVLTTVSHELRRPLTAMLGWARMLRAGSSDDTARGLEVIERSANMQLRLIEELLDVSRAATGQLGVTLSLVNLNTILRNVTDAAKPAASGRRVDLITKFTSDYTPVRGDGIRLQQILGNLVGNAIKFTPPGGRVTAMLDHANEHAQIVVADTGIGIDPKMVPHVFEPFWQADASTSQSREGLGLGLSIARRLVELHGGTIEAYSLGAGLGTRMTVTLPLAMEAARKDPS